MYQRKQWTNSEYNFLLESYGKLTISQIARALNRSYCAISHKITAFHESGQLPIYGPGGEITDTSIFRYWSKPEIEFIKENYGHLTHEEMGKALDRSRGAVTRVVMNLGLQDTWSPALNLTPVEIAYLAGIIDGEGSLSIIASWRDEKLVGLAPVLHIVNTNKNLMDWIFERFIKAFRQTHAAYRDRRSRKVLHSIHVTGCKNLKVILETTFPYLIVKKPHAEILLQLIGLKQKRLGLAMNPKAVELAIQLKEHIGWDTPKSKIAQEKLRSWLEQLQ